jgi:CHAD domain-containing protein
MEIFAGAFEPWFRKDLYRQVETLQEKLGEINDHATAQERLQSWLTDDNCELRGALEALIAEEKEALEQSRRHFLNWWTLEHRDELRRGFARTIASQQEIISPRLELDQERA